MCLGKKTSRKLAKFVIRGKKQKCYNLFFSISDLLSGTYALLSYASMIFDEAGSNLSANTSAIIVCTTEMFEFNLNVHF